MKYVRFIIFPLLGFFASRGVVCLAMHGTDILRPHVHGGDGDASAYKTD